MFHTCKAALEHMRPGATIINTASIQAYQPDPMLLAYAATKAAIVNFTKGLAQETIEHGIRVNAVAPGPIWTPLIPATMPEEKVDDFGAEESPMKRAGQPAELAPVYVFLASQESSYVNGEVIGVTGGNAVVVAGERGGPIPVTARLRRGRLGQHGIRRAQPDAGRAVLDPRSDAPVLHGRRAALSIHLRFSAPAAR